MSTVSYFYNCFICSSSLFDLSLLSFPIIFSSLIILLLQSNFYVFDFSSFFSIPFLSTLIHEHDKKLYFGMTYRLVFLSNTDNCLNKWSCTTYVCNILNRLYVIFIINKQGIHMFWLLCGFTNTTDTIEGKLHQNPVHSLLFIRAFSRMDLLWSESHNSPSLLSQQTLIKSSIQLHNINSLK